MTIYLIAVCYGVGTISILNQMNINMLLALLGERMYMQHNSVCGCGRWKILIIFDNSIYVFDLQCLAKVFGRAQISFHVDISMVE